MLNYVDSIVRLLLALQATRPCMLVEVRIDLPCCETPSLHGAFLPRWVIGRVLFKGKASGKDDQGDPKAHEVKNTAV